MGESKFWRKASHLLAVAIASAPVIAAQPDLLARPAQQWAGDAAKNEMKVLEYDGGYLRYRMHLVDSKGDMVRDVIESKDGPVARLVLKDGRSLTTDEDHAEQERLQSMLDSPEMYDRHMKSERSGKKQAAQLIGALPEAMLYSYTPGQPQREHHAADQPAEIVLDLRPNPAWTPPNLLSEALAGMEGRVWIEPATHTMTRLEAHVFRSINVGWGIFAHVYPGGTATFEQVRVSNTRWIFSHFVEHATVRALMLKTIREDVDVQASGFSPVAKMSYQDGIHLLLGTPAANH